MRRRVVSLCLALALLLLPAAAFAQNGSYTSGFQIQNLSNSTASVSVQFVNPDGTTATTQSGTIAANQSVTFFPLGAPPTGFTGADVPAGFKGSVVISSDQPVAAITNILQSSFAYGGSYNGFSTGDTSVTLPIIQRNNGNYNSWYSVQNLGSSTATVNVAYTHGTAGTDTTEPAQTIAPGASHQYNQDTNANLGATFVGIAKVTSDQPIAVVVNQEGNNQILTYDGLPAGSASSTVLLPLVMSSNGGFFTGTGATNVGSSVTDITVTYSANSVTGAGACATPPAQTFPAVPASSGVFSIQQPGFPGFSAPGFDGCRYIGSAIVTSSGQNLVAVVNQLGGSYASSYEGFNPALATSTVKAPLIMSNNGGYFTGIQVQNADTANTSAVNISITYGANTVSGAGTCGALSPVTGSITGGQSFTKLQLAGTDPTNDPQFNGCRYIGNATITGPAGSKLLAIVNELNFSAGDQLLTYSGFNQ